MSSQPSRVADFLEGNPNIKFSAREIATQIIKLHPEIYREKAGWLDSNPENLIKQVVAEIGSSKNNIARKNSKIKWQDKPSPRVFWFDSTDVNIVSVDDLIYATKEDEEDSDFQIIDVDTNKDYTESDLYPIFMEYIKSEHEYYPRRIDEKRSKNMNGANANKWLHPDVVALEAVDREWNNQVRNCSERIFHLYSYELKKEITKSNLRESFYQAVSNSSWSNNGYLVTAKIKEESFIMSELKLLSDLHGIGVILLNVENPSESEILFHAKYRTLDWRVINRIVIENSDFEAFINDVSLYKQTGQVVTTIKA